MKNLCTVSDINYLYKCLTLFESLMDSSDDFILHYLCIDDLTYDKIKKNESPNLVPHHINELLKDNHVLSQLKLSDYRYFCWSLASFFSNYLLKMGVDSVMYIDSDIFFHRNIDEIYT